jgi:hypothetical protein
MFDPATGSIGNGRGDSTGEMMHADDRPVSLTSRARCASAPMMTCKSTGKPTFWDDSSAGLLAIMALDLRFDSETIEGSRRHRLGVCAAAPLRDQISSNVPARRRCAAARRRGLDRSTWDDRAAPAKVRSKDLATAHRCGRSGSRRWQALPRSSLPQKPTQSRCDGLSVDSLGWPPAMFEVLTWLHHDHGDRLDRWRRNPVPALIENSLCGAPGISDMREFPACKPRPCVALPAQ